MILSTRESRISAYLSLTVGIMVLEFAYGYVSNSLGLMSDSFHMLLDAISLVVGLLATHISKRRSNNENPFGYGRYEVLCSFTNGILLIFIAFCVLVESITRLVSAPPVEGSYLFLVSLIGLIVNIIGVAFFHGLCSHSRECHSDHNMRGIYLHILADLLGSVSVLLSTFALSFGVWIADPICSFISSVLIFGSALPLVLDTGKILVLCGEESAKAFPDGLYSEINSKCSVTDLQTPYIWIHSTAPHYLCICTISAKLKPNTSYEQCKNDVSSTTQFFFAQKLGGNLRVIVHLER